MSRIKDAQELLKTYEKLTEKPEIFNLCKDDIRETTKLSAILDIMISLAVIADKLTEGSEDENNNV